MLFTRAFVGYIGGDLRRLFDRPNERERYLVTTGASYDDAREAAVMWRLLDTILGCGAEGTAWTAGFGHCEGGPAAIRADRLAVARIDADFGRGAALRPGSTDMLAAMCRQAADALAPFEVGTACKGGEPLAHVGTLAMLYGIAPGEVPADAVVYTVTVPERLRMPVR